MVLVFLFHLRNKIWFGYTMTAFKAGRGYLK